MMSATSPRSHGEIESGPAALCILSYESSLWTTLKDMLMSGIDGVELCPRLGKILSSCVYADLNCVLSI
jgi:CheY-like chemotaxis protein